MPEQKRATDPAVEDAEKSLDELRLQHSNSSSLDPLRLQNVSNNNTSNNNRFNSFSGSVDTEPCAMPRRRSSASGGMAYMALSSDYLSDDSFDDLDDLVADEELKSQDTTEFTELTDGCSMRSLQGSIDETDPFQVGLYGDDDVGWDDYDRHPMPNQNSADYDSCKSLQGSTDMFDSFQSGLLDEEDVELGPYNDSDITKKSSNTTTSKPKTTQDQHRSGMAAMKSAAERGKYDSCQVGLLHEEDVERSNYSMPNYNTPRISNKKTSDIANDFTTPRRNSNFMAAMNQSLDLEDVFGSKSVY
eukprot:CAMPEP_0113605940 /NCGR_PEP_ID=MMETSP0017_2-20120614/2594_1 /TAXON_ID=2856 /ORGANISM="Cylindrotheca closterium" /LENGTH=301 /DNA_ID=CAMNT_0000514461 /DNA_START=482 /DNA_END=1387 /DNA_ORIENTATION=- /assembly_acc=CAM_ASM_000147